MIKALLLIFDPVAAWERIVVDQRRWLGVLGGYLIPLLLLVSFVEGYGLSHWGKARPGISQVKVFSLRETVAFETGQLVLSLIVVFAGAKVIKSLGETFHSRHSFTQAFTVAVYGLSPVFLLRMFNAFKEVSPWVCWIIGVALCFWILYQGLPMVMKPDPSHAFGLYLTSCLLLTMISGLARLVSTAYLQGRLAGFEETITRLIS